MSVSSFANAITAASEGDAPVINESTENLSSSAASPDIAYTYYRLNSDGSSSENSVDSSPVIDTNTPNSPWLSSGSPSDVWVERSISGDALDLDEIGASRVQLGSNRRIGIQENSLSLKSSTVTLTFYDVASGGSSIGVITVNLTASQS